jgi:serine/threonine protein kinase
VQSFNIASLIEEKYIFEVMEEKIGNYKILKKIGAGGMARVFLGVHEDVPNLKVVLKILDDPSLVDRFRQEADKLALLDGHPNICRIKHFFNHGENIVIAMEYIDGFTLDEKIKRDGKLPLADAMNIACKVLDILSFAHEKGIYHRDIKPSNIMIDHNGNVKIIDFGIAKAKTDPNLTRAGTACGTPAYMAPEQFNPSEDTDYAKADIYAVGTTLFYSLTGELPFKGDNEFAIRDAKLFSDPPKPSSISSDLPRNVDQLILKAIDKEPTKRFATAKAMQRTIEGLGCVESDKTHIAAPAGRDTSGPKKKKPLAAIIGFIIIIAAGIIGYFMFVGKEQPATLLPPKLMEPAHNIQLAGASPSFKWEASAGEKGFYNLEYSRNPNFTDKTFMPRLRQTSYVDTSNLPDGQYYWRVEAISAEGISSGYSQVNSFTIRTAPVITTGYLDISSTMAADLYLNDSLIARQTTRAFLTLDSGPYTIRAASPASSQGNLNERIIINPQDTATINFAFSPKPVVVSLPIDEPVRPKLPDSAWFRIATPAYTNVQVYIDDVLQNRTAPGRFWTSVGQHEIKVLLDKEGQTVTKTDRVDVKAGTEVKITFDFSE